ncbi:unnamed protein product [Amoebophrya sp. A120]|nr:unnamed protein product [Amoebophrya sp. A120]|eukprot:GSA120T00006518001.1
MSSTNATSPSSGRPSVRSSAISRMGGDDENAGGRNLVRPSRVPPTDPRDSRKDPARPRMKRSRSGRDLSRSKVTPNENLQLAVNDDTKYDVFYQDLENLAAEPVVGKSLRNESDKELATRTANGVVVLERTQSGRMRLDGGKTATQGSAVLFLDDRMNNSANSAVGVASTDDVILRKKMMDAPDFDDNMMAPLTSNSGGTGDTLTTRNRTAEGSSTQAGKAKLVGMGVALAVLIAGAVAGVFVYKEFFDDDSDSGGLAACQPGYGRTAAGGACVAIGDAASTSSADTVEVELVAQRVDMPVSFSYPGTPQQAADAVVSDPDLQAGFLQGFCVTLGSAFEGDNCQQWVSIASATPATAARKNRNLQGRLWSSSSVISKPAKIMGDGLQKNEDHAALPSAERMRQLQGEVDVELDIEFEVDVADNETANALADVVQYIDKDTLKDNMNKEIPKAIENSSTKTQEQKNQLKAQIKMKEIKQMKADKGKRRKKKKNLPKTMVITDDEGEGANGQQDGAAGSSSSGAGGGSSSSSNNGGGKVKLRSVVPSNEFDLAAQIMSNSCERDVTKELAETEAEAPSLADADVAAGAPHGPMDLGNWAQILQSFQEVFGEQAELRQMLVHVKPQRWRCLNNDVTDLVGEQERLEFEQKENDRQVKLQEKELEEKIAARAKAKAKQREDDAKAKGEAAEQRRKQAKADREAAEEKLKNAKNDEERQRFEREKKDAKEKEEKEEREKNEQEARKKKEKLEQEELAQEMEAKKKEMDERKARQRQEEARRKAEKTKDAEEKKKAEAEALAAEAELKEKELKRKEAQAEREKLRAEREKEDAKVREIQAAKRKAAAKKQREEAQERARVAKEKADVEAEAQAKAEAAAAAEQEEIERLQEEEEQKRREKAEAERLEKQREAQELREKQEAEKQRWRKVQEEKKAQEAEEAAKKAEKEKKAAEEEEKQLAEQAAREQSAQKKAELEQRRKEAEERKAAAEQRRKEQQERRAAAEAEKQKAAQEQKAAEDRQKAEQALRQEAKRAREQKQKEVQEASQKKNKKQQQAKDMSKERQRQKNQRGGKRFLRAGAASSSEAFDTYSRSLAHSDEHPEEKWSAEQAAYDSDEAEENEKKEKEEERARHVHQHKTRKDYRRPITIPATIQYKGKRWSQVGLSFLPDNRETGKFSRKSLKKRSWALNFGKFRRRQRFYGFKRLKLVTSNGDKSRMREKLMTDLYALAGLAVAHTQYYVVYLDSTATVPSTNKADYKFLGIYLAMEDAKDTVRQTEFFRSTANGVGNALKTDLSVEWEAMESDVRKGWAASSSNRRMLLPAGTSSGHEKVAAPGDELHHQHLEERQLQETDPTDASISLPPVDEEENEIALPVMPTSMYHSTGDLYKPTPTSARLGLPERVTRTKEKTDLEKEEEAENLDTEELKQMAQRLKDRKEKAAKGLSVSQGGKQSGPEAAIKFKTEDGSGGPAGGTTSGSTSGSNVLDKKTEPLKKMHMLPKRAVNGTESLKPYADYRAMLHALHNVPRRSRITKTVKEDSALAALASGATVVARRRMLQQQVRREDDNPDVELLRQLQTEDTTAQQQLKQKEREKRKRPWRMWKRFDSHRDPQAQKWRQQLGKTFDYFSWVKYMAVSAAFANDKIYGSEQSGGGDYLLYNAPAGQANFNHAGPVCMIESCLPSVQTGPWEGKEGNLTYIYSYASPPAYTNPTASGRLTWLPTQFASAFRGKGKMTSLNFKKLRPGWPMLQYLYEDSVSRAYYLYALEKMAQPAPCAQSWDKAAGNWVEMCGTSADTMPFHEDMAQYLFAKLAAVGRGSFTWQQVLTNLVSALHAPGGLVDDKLLQKQVKHYEQLITSFITQEDRALEKEQEDETALLEQKAQEEKEAEVDNVSNLLISVGGATDVSQVEANLKANTDDVETQEDEKVYDQFSVAALDADGDDSTDDKLELKPEKEKADQDKAKTPLEFFQLGVEQLRRKLAFRVKVVKEGVPVLIKKENEKKQ